ncbi:hypothetical protein TD3509T_60214 [Tenacibaculum dicentrarchi]|uniref:Lipoprotein n=1 Tax=Tenacibaculum dicentrarchi TaxID=669041 RepID=A0ABM9NZS9_9FLAO|nr:hypothetical protein TD3509T_60214 [Tenacibaculum dicentrarchi]
MNKVIGIIILFCCLSSCSKDKKNKLCVDLKEMQYKDQLLRGVMTDNPYIEILDSILKTKNYTHKDYKTLPSEERKKYSLKTIEIMKLRPPLTVKEKIKNDSLMQEQIKLDNINTPLLISLIKKRGYPNKDNCNCELIKNQMGDLFPATIFRHSQPQYWDEIRTLVNIEKKKNRLSNNAYKFVITHINGRNNNN